MMPSPGPPPEQHDPAQLAERAFGSKDPERLYFAALAGLWAGRKGLQPGDCPFDDPAMREKWLWYRKTAAAAKEEQRQKHTGDLFQPIN